MSSGKSKTSNYRTDPYAGWWFWTSYEKVEFLECRVTSYPHDKDLIKDKKVLKKSKCCPKGQKCHRLKNYGDWYDI